MNAYTAAVRHLSELASPVTRHRRDVRRLSFLTERYGNEDCISEDYALDALMAGRPAYWAMCGSSAQIIWIVANEANQGKPLGEAIEGNYPEHRAWQRERALDNLIPLNLSAAKELARAYERFAGTWRDIEELEGRAS